MKLPRRAVLGNQDHVPTGRNPAVEAQPFSQQPLDPISNDRVSYFLGNRQPEPPMRAHPGLLSHHRQHVATVQLATAGLDREVVDTLPQPHLLADAQQGQRGQRTATRHGASKLLLRDRDRDALASLRTATAEDFATTAGFLAGAKPVGALATLVMWLVGTLHGSTPPCGEGHRY